MVWIYVQQFQIMLLHFDLPFLKVKNKSNYLFTIDDDNMTESHDLQLSNYCLDTKRAQSNGIFYVKQSIHTEIIKMILLFDI
jgi:hypothetical protein